MRCNGWEVATARETPGSRSKCSLSARVVGTYSSRSSHTPVGSNAKRSPRSSLGTSPVRHAAPRENMRLSGGRERRSRETDVAEQGAVGSGWENSRLRRRWTRPSPECRSDDTGAGSASSSTVASRDRGEQGRVDHRPRRAPESRRDHVRPLPRDRMDHGRRRSDRREPFGTKSRATHSPRGLARRRRVVISPR